jgi:DNA-binding HxlR family transcriptional regulator
VRLKELKAAGLVSADDGYAATPLARELLDALAPLMAWSERWAAAGTQAD